MKLLNLIVLPQIVRSAGVLELQTTARFTYTFV